MSSITKLGESLSEVITGDMRVLTFLGKNVACVNYTKPVLECIVFNEDREARRKQERLE